MNVGIAKAATTSSVIERLVFMMCLAYKLLGMYAIITNVMIIGIKRIGFYFIVKLERKVSIFILILLLKNVK